MQSDEDEDFVGFGLRRGGQDKLTFRQVLYKVVMQYLNSFGTFKSKKAVERLIAAVYFDEPGLKLKKEIDIIYDELERERIDKVRKIKKKMGREFYGRANQAKIKFKIAEWYWDTLYERVYQCLADHNLIIEAEKLTKIRIKKDVDEIEEGDDYGSERGFESLYD